MSGWELFFFIFLSFLLFLRRLRLRLGRESCQCWMTEFRPGMAKGHGATLGWYKSASGFLYSSPCLMRVTSNTQIVNECLIWGLQHTQPARSSEDPNFLKPVLLPAACHNFSQLLPISTLSPLFQNASLASRTPVVFSPYCFFAFYDEPESSEGALETN